MQKYFRLSTYPGCAAHVAASFALRKVPHRELENGEIYVRQLLNLVFRSSSAAYCQSPETPSPSFLINFSGVFKTYN